MQGIGSRTKGQLVATVQPHRHLGLIEDNHRLDHAAEDALREVLLANPTRRIGDSGISLNWQLGVLVGIKAALDGSASTEDIPARVLDEVKRIYQEVSGE
jgi:hypothetical protein